MDQLQSILGESYHEGMTVEEINSVLSGKKFADLSTGAYVDKNKYEADTRAKDTELANLKNQLKSKMTEDEQKTAAESEKDSLIEQLKKQIEDSNKSYAKSNAEATLSSTKTLLGIKDDDNEFGNFLSSISSDNLENTKTLAKYVNKLVQDSYTKGKKDATKDNLGAFGKHTETGATDGSSKEGYGTRLAKANKSMEVDSSLYFKRK